MGTTAAGSAALVRQMQGEMRRRDYSARSLAERSGVAESTLKRWDIHNPRLDLFENALEALGLKLVIVRREPGA